LDCHHHGQAAYRGASTRNLTAGAADGIEMNQEVGKKSNGANV
jgi:hypothetical protein